MTLKIEQSHGWTYRANVIVVSSTRAPMPSISSFMRRRKSTGISRFEKAKILHEYAMNNQGNFPRQREVHPVYPEWKWGTWANVLLEAYFDNSLDENIKSYMEDSIHWRSRIEQRKQTRESKIGRMPIPEHFEKAKLLHEYAEDSDGEFPTRKQVHPEYPEWKWGSWVNVLLVAYFNNNLDDHVKSYMEGSVHWRSRIEQIKQARENRVGKMPIPEHYEKVKLLHEYATNNQGNFPRKQEVHPEYPEWKWGSWVDVLLVAFFNNSLDENVKSYMEGSVHWRSRIEQIKQTRESRVGKYEKAKLLHEFAENNQGEFPLKEEAHPEYPEWKWGNWVNKLLVAYFNNNLDENVKAYMESSVHWRSRIEQIKQTREGRIYEMPIPEHSEKAKLLHEYAEDNEGEFPTRNQVHPEYPEWKWGQWVNFLIKSYFNNSLDGNVKAYMDDSVHWRSRIEQIKQAREDKVGTMPIPEHYEKAKLLHKYAEDNEGEFPNFEQAHPQYPEWKWGSWVYVLLRFYFQGNLDENVKAYMDDSVHWRSRIEELKQKRESKVGTMPIPEHYEKAKLLHEYAEDNEGEFPKLQQVHPEYPEWKWGNWVYFLIKAYFNNSLDENVKAYMEDSVHWSSKIEQMKQTREDREGKMPIPEHYEKAKLLHEYAERNKGNFPKFEQVHPEYPEWKWGSWVYVLLTFYFQGNLDENVKAYMEDSVHWRSRIEELKQKRESKVGTMSIPEHYEKAKLLHEYAEDNEGEFPKLHHVHPEYPEWNWGSWVNTLLRCYLSGDLNQETIDVMEASPYWRSRIESRIALRRETTWSPPPKPPKPKQARMLHAYAENNGGAFPTPDEIHPEFPEWRRSSWVEKLVNDYLIDALDYETRKILHSSIHWKARIQERREELKHIQRRLLGEYRV